MEEQQPQPLPPNKSTRSFEDWKKSLIKIIEHSKLHKGLELEDERIRLYYDQGLMPTVAFNELFNK